MTFLTKAPLARVFQHALNLAIQIKSRSDSFISTAKNEAVTGQRILNLFDELKNADASFATITTTSGLADYARAQMDDTSIDIVAEFAIMRNAIQAVIAWVTANAGDQILMPSIDLTGTVIYPQFTPAQTTDLRIVLQTLSDKIG